MAPCQPKAISMASVSSDLPTKAVLYAVHCSSEALAKNGGTRQALDCCISLVFVHDILAIIEMYKAH